MLQHISTNACPHCGSTQVISESIDVDHGSREIRQHVNGQRWERRTFACGHEVQWVPNFSAEQHAGECQRAEAFQQRQAKRKAAYAKLTAYVQKLDVDESFKEAALRSIQHFR